MSLKILILLFITAFLLCVTAHGQTPATPQPETKTVQQKQEDAQKALTAQALDLLDVVVKDTERLTLPQNRTYLSITTAELLWQYDEAGARALFKNAMADLRAILSTPLETVGPRSYSEKPERIQLREKVLLALARRDGRMARDFMAETRDLLFAKTEGQADGEAELETRIAAVIAANDPTQAFEMAEKSLAKGFNSTLPNLVVQIQQKDAEMATKLANEILAKLKTVNLTTNQEAATVALRLLQIATETSQPNAKSTKQDPKPLLTEQSLRELAELIAAAVLELPQEVAERSSLNVLSVMTQLDKYAPARAAQLRRRSSQANTEPTDQQQAWQQYQQLSETGTVEALIEAADKAEPGMREGYYRQAALKLVNEDKGDSARQLITEHVTDADQRQRLLAEIDKQVLATAAAQGKLEETRNSLSRATSVEERITTLAQLAMVLSQKGNKKVALQLLEEARNLLPSRARYARQFLSQLQLARAYASVDATQSFGILEPSIDQLNELIAAGILLGEFLGEEEVVRNDELLIVFVGQLSEMFQAQYGRDLAALSTADFARTRAVADRFQRFEVRLMARLLVVQSVLGEKAAEAVDTLPKQQTTESGPVTIQQTVP